MNSYVKILLIIVAGFLMLLLIIPAATSSMITVVLGGGEEEETSEIADEDWIYVSMYLSSEVERYREQVLEQAKKQGMEQYIELFLAVMQQESGGNGNDVFQASESKGLPPNALNVMESIEQGVKYLSLLLKRANVKSQDDIPNIKLALQGYNFGGSYIDYAVSKDGKWTQKNTFAFAKKQSGGKRNTGSRVEALGPWRYGDQYYTAHVLRYYSVNSMATENTSVLAVPLKDRMTYLFPNGTPTKAEDMNQYLKQIEVPIYTTKKKKSKMSITVHKSLVNEVIAAFTEIADKRFPIDPTCTAGYCWRTMASNSSKLSYHSYGVAIDVNWTHNGASYTQWPYNPQKDKLAVTKKIVNIWKKHGFYWGGDWSGNSFDPMHFSYVNH